MAVAPSRPGEKAELVLPVAGAAQAVRGGLGAAYRFLQGAVAGAGRALKGTRDVGKLAQRRAVEAEKAAIRAEKEKARRFRLTQQQKGLVAAGGAVGAGVAGPALLEQLGRDGDGAVGGNGGSQSEEDDVAPGPGADADGGSDGAAHGGERAGGGKKASANGRGAAVPVPLPTPALGVVRVDRAAVRAQAKAQRVTARAQVAVERERTRQALVHEGSAAVRQAIASLGDVLATAAQHKGAGLLLASTPLALLVASRVPDKADQLHSGLAAALSGPAAYMGQEGDAPAQRQQSPVVDPSPFPSPGVRSWDFTPAMSSFAAQPGNVVALRNPNTGRAASYVRLQDGSWGIIGGSEAGLAPQYASREALLDAALRGGWVGA